MKKIVEVTQPSAFEELLGKNVVIYACRFIYTGILTGVDAQTLVLKDAQIIYDTGEHAQPKKQWTNVEPCWSNVWHVQIASIESFGLSPF